MSEIYKVSVEEVNNRVDQIAKKFLNEKSWQQPISIYGVPKGGLAPAYALVSSMQQRGIDAIVTDNPQEVRIIIDDVIDSGKTRDYFLKLHSQANFIALIDKTLPDSQFKNIWVSFPWEISLEETDQSAHDIVTRLLQFIGEDPNRKELIKTPKRVIEAWKFWTQGYGKSAEEILQPLPSGNDEIDEMIMLHNIPVYSHCEHHLTPIIGIAHIGYIPKEKIIGLSKLARIVDMFSRRLQMQERLTNQIADAIFKYLEPKGTGIIVRAKHFCMITRGAQMPSGLTTTSAMRGVLLTKPEARAEFLTLCRDAEDA